MDLSQIRIKVSADTREAESNLNKLKQTGQNLSSVGAGLTMGLTAPIIGLGAASLMAASDANEMKSKFNTVFKDLAKDAESWANTYADSIGRSKYEIQEAISNQADLYQGMGFTADEALNLSKNATELAYDLASFNNVNDAQAVDAMTKAMMGETESMKALGVNLTDTIMEQSEFTAATGKSWKELTMAEKANVRYQEAMKQSKNAIGDATKTSDSFANMTKRVKGQMEELGVQIGNVLLPIAEKMITAFSGMIDKLVAFLEQNPQLAQFIVIVAGIAAAIGPALFVIGQLMTALAALPALFNPVSLAIAAFALLFGAAFVGMNEQARLFVEGLPAQIQGMLDTFIASATTFLEQLPATVVSGLTLFLDAVMAGLPVILQAGTDILFSLIDGILTMVPTLIQTGVDLMFGLWETMFAYGPQFLQMGWTFLQNLIQGAIDKFPTLISTFMDRISGVIQSIVNRMPEFIAKGVEFVSKMAQGFAQNFPALVSKAIELITKIITTIISKMPQFIAQGAEFVVKLGKGLWDNRSKIFGIIGDVIKGCLDAIGNLVSGFFNMGVSIVQSIWDGIKSMWSSLTGWVSEKVKSIPIIGGLFTMRPEVDDSGLVAPAMEGSAVFSRSAAPFGTSRLSSFSDMATSFGAATRVSPLKAQLGNSASSATDALGKKLDGLIGVIEEMLPGLQKEYTVVMDTGALVGQLAPGVNRHLATQSKYRERGR